MWFNNTYPLSPFKRSLSIFRLFAFLGAGLLLLWFITRPEYPAYPRWGVEFIFSRSLPVIMFASALMEVITLNRSAAARRASK